MSKQAWSRAQHNAFGMWDVVSYGSIHLAPQTIDSSQPTVQPSRPFHAYIHGMLHKLQAGASPELPA